MDVSSYYVTLGDTFESHDTISYEDVMDVDAFDDGLTTWQDANLVLVI